jgi:hypothetical protein
VGTLTGPLAAYAPPTKYRPDTIVSSLGLAALLSFPSTLL